MHQKLLRLSEMWSLQKSQKCSVLGPNDQQRSTMMKIYEYYKCTVFIVLNSKESPFKQPRSKNQEESLGLSP